MVKNRKDAGISDGQPYSRKDKLLPPNGVYAVRSAVGGRSYCGITDIGTKPTVDGQFVGVETYLYGCDESTDLYGEKTESGAFAFSASGKEIRVS